MFIPQENNTQSYQCQYEIDFDLKNTRPYALTMSKLRENLQREMDLRKWNAYDMEDRSTVPQPTTNRFLKGKQNDPRDATVKKWATALGISEAQLRGLSITNTPDPAQRVEAGPALGEFSAIPVVGSAQLGDNGHWSELEYPVGFGDGHITYPTRDKNAYALRCHGDSMKPRIRDGEFVIVEPNSEPIPGDEILLKTHDGRVMVKTLLYQRDDKVHVMSVNEAHPPQAFNLAEIDKIHLVAAIAKKALWHKE